jgi:hypothetical protein
MIATIFFLRLSKEASAVDHLQTYFCYGFVMNGAAQVLSLRAALQTNCEGT